MGQALSGENPNEAENVPQPFLGCRVVRGPDWKWDEQDGGDGHMGTLQKYKDSEEVMIVWDKGTVANYRCSDSHDLRILDSGSAGVKHDTITCDSCRKTPVFGTRWTCSECDNYDLCSACYHGDKHILQHRFYCIDLPERTKKLVEARENSTKIPAYGLFANARVLRGVDWQWGIQDGLVPGSPGKITEIRGWDESNPRTAAAVSWDHGINNVYRVGFKGKVDLKAVSEVTAFSFYRDHLPVLETYASYTKFSINDRVRIDLDLETFKSLQENHGGWVEDMQEAIGHTGKIIAFRSSDVFVLYPDGKRWLLNPAVLTRLDSDTEDEGNQHTTATESNSSNKSLGKPSFKVGDLVQISSDILTVRLLQLGHGEWIDAMIPTLGKVGKVRKILGDNDLRVFVAGRKWTYNAACVSHIDAIQEDLSECLSALLKKMCVSEKVPGPTEELVKAATDNDLQKAGELLSAENLQINGLFAGCTALQAASQNGAVGVVKLLIDSGVDLEAEGKGGTRAIHHAAHGDSVSILQLLAQAGADLNARTNAGRSALHVAVNMNRTDSVRRLLELEARPSLQDGIGDTPLHDAISNDQVEIVQLLLEFKADISITNTNGFNCLQFAVFKEKVDAIKAMIATRPPPQVINEKRDDGFTPLHIAIVKEYVEVAALLIQEGKADVNAQNAKLQSPLHLAILEQNLELVQLLVKEGASLELVDKDGDTPLHEAVRYHCVLQLKQLHGLGNLEMLLMGIGAVDPRKKSTSIACFLVEQGADLSSKNNMNRTPLDLCIDSKLSEALAKSRIERSSSDTDNHIKNNAPDGTSVEGTTGVEVSESDGESTASDSAKIQPTSEPQKAAPSLESKQTPNYASNKRGDVYENSNQNYASNDNFSQMKQELDDMKQQALCPVCMDRNRNLAFMCGHTTCQFCGDRVKECPICRKPVVKRVLLF